MYENDTVYWPPEPCGDIQALDVVFSGSDSDSSANLSMKIDWNNSVARQNDFLSIQLVKPSKMILIFRKNQRVVPASEYDYTECLDLEYSSRSGGSLTGNLNLSK